MTPIETKASMLHLDGFNCAQCVLGANSEALGLDTKTALMIGGGFGGGARCGELCGAVSGAIMAMGVLAPYVEGDDIEAKARVANLTREMTRTFRGKYEHLRCVDLIRAAGGQHRCDEFIRFCAELVAKTIAREQNAEK